MNLVVIKDKELELHVISVNSKLIVYIEAVSALDLSIKSQVLNLLDDLQKELGFNVSFYCS